MHLLPLRAVKLSGQHNLPVQSQQAYAIDLTNPKEGGSIWNTYGKVEVNLFGNTQCPMWLTDRTETEVFDQAALAHDSKTKSKSLCFYCGTLPLLWMTMQPVIHGVLQWVCFCVPYVSTALQTWPTFPNDRVTVVEKTTHFEIRAMVPDSNPSILPCVQNVRHIIRTIFSQWCESRHKYIILHSIWWFWYAMHYLWVLSVIILWGHQGRLWTLMTVLIPGLHWF